MAEHKMRNFKAVVLGVSTGGTKALKSLLGSLPRAFPLPVMIVLHISRESDGGPASLFDQLSEMRVKEAEEQETPVAGAVYFAPANYHLLVEPDGRFALSTDPPVNFARPSVDVLFESAADVFGTGLIGIVLTGAGCDGSRGLKRIKEMGGVAIVQDPQDAEADPMPRNAVQAVKPDHLVALTDLPGLLQRLSTT